MTTTLLGGGTALNINTRCLTDNRNEKTLIAVNERKKLNKGLMADRLLMDGWMMIITVCKRRAQLHRQPIELADGVDNFFYCILKKLKRFTLLSVIV